MSGDRAQMADLLAPFRSHPERCAVLTDLDGTLAPIVDRPEDAAVPPETAEVLRDLAKRMGLVAVVTGRRAMEAREMVGLDELTYAGNQGFELLRRGEGQPEADPAAGPRSDAVASFLAKQDWDHLSALGVRQEDKGPIQVLHWRGCEDTDEAERASANLAESARGAGLIPLWGRKVLELRPVAGFDKGTAVHSLVLDHAPLDAALFAGDDRTDLDAFAALSRLAGTSRLRAAVRLGVDSPESPDEIAVQADLVVDGTGGVLEILRQML